MKPNVFIVCTGVGHINRGYESFTVECFEALRNSPGFQLYLLKGGGKQKDRELKIACIKRNSKLADFFLRKFSLDKYKLEQITFLIGMLPSLIKYKPSVIYYSDFGLGTYLWHLRKYFKFKYKLLFANGAPNGPPFKTEDHVQQLLPIYLEQAIAWGEPQSRQTLLPYGFSISVQERLINLNRKNEFRQKLNIPLSATVILSVGAINKHHKRMDYIINEIERLPSNYYLIILGQYEEETKEILLLANKIKGRCFISNVPYSQVCEYYVAADYFVLASLLEGFGRVIVEAESYGLNCIVHDYVNSRQVLQKYGHYIDMQMENSLVHYLLEKPVILNSSNLVYDAYDRYSWDVLSDFYRNMIINCYS